MQSTPSRHGRATVAKNFSSVRVGLAVENITGLIVDRASLRAIDLLDDDDDHFDGPLYKVAKKTVYNVTLKEESTNLTLKVYFYNTWAEKCSFLDVGNRVKITGPASIVYMWGEVLCLAVMSQPKSSISVAVSIGNLLCLLRGYIKADYIRFSLSSLIFLSCPSYSRFSHHPHTLRRLLHRKLK